MRLIFKGTKEEYEKFKRAFISGLCPSAMGLREPDNCDNGLDACETCWGDRLPLEFEEESIRLSDKDLDYVVDKIWERMKKECAVEHGGR